MDKIIASIRERIEECKRTGSMFTMPRVDGCVVEEREGDTSGAILVHSVFTVSLSDGRSITVDYQSKDKSRSFSVVPDRSCISVTSSDHSNDFSDSWDEK